MYRLRPFACALLLMAVAMPAGAAEVTEVIDAADGDDPYDFTVEIIYSRSLKRAKITREYNCDAKLREQDNDTCPGTADQPAVPGQPPGAAGALVETKELRYEQVIHTITPRLRFGIWHDLELQVDLPVVLANDQTVRFAGTGGTAGGVAITPEISSIAPGPRPDATDPENLFDVPTDLPTRAGFGDMQLMLRFSPFAQERDDARADWTLELGYRIPTGETMKQDNEGVGRGVHELTLATAVARRYRYIEPYTRVFVTFPFPAGDTLFKDYGDSQEHIGPGIRGGFDTGMEVVPYEDPAKQLKFFIDVGVGATLHGEGRDYSELFDALAIGALACDPSGPEGEINCGRYNPDSQSEIAGQPHDGVTTVEQFLSIRTHLGFGLQASKYLKLGAQVAFEHDTEHFLSTADIGKDLDGSGLVESRDDPSGRYAPREHNPTFVSAIDALGRRLRIEETTIFTAAFNAAFLF